MWASWRVFLKTQFLAVPSLLDNLLEQVWREEMLVKGDSIAPWNEILYSSLHKVIVQELMLNLKLLSCSSAGTNLKHEMEGRAVCIVWGFFLCSCFPVLGNNQGFFSDVIVCKEYTSVYFYMHGTSLWNRVCCTDEVTHSFVLMVMEKSVTVHSLHP